jgi:hypothetical protein
MDTRIIRQAIGAIVRYKFDIVAQVSSKMHTYVTVKPDYVHRYSTVRKDFRIHNQTLKAEQYTI